jgi:hypothetical protein
VPGRPAEQSAKGRRLIRVDLGQRLAEEKAGTETSTARVQPAIVSTTSDQQRRPMTSKP